MEYTSLITFTFAAILLNLSPGPSLLFVSARGVGDGKAAGAVSALGLATGSSIHAVLAGLGITAVVAQDKNIATAVAVIGGLYVLYLGYSSLKDARNVSTCHSDVSETKKKSLKKIYIQAISVEFLNPKTIIFYLSILPGLIISSGYSVWQALMVSLIVPATALPIDMTAGLSSGMLATMSEKNRQLTIFLNYTSGLALLFIGIFLIYSNI